VIRAGSFGSVPELVRDIKAYLAERNQNPRPYAWKPDGDPRQDQACPRRHLQGRGRMSYWSPIASQDTSPKFLNG
jgi:hypothetical protein